MTQITTLTMLSISELNFGQDHPDIAANVRKTDREVGEAELRASIESDGLLQPLLVWNDGGKYFVVDGSRRLSVLKSGTSAGTSNNQIPCLLITGGDAKDAMAKSLAANMLQIPLHQVDQYETFSALYANDKDEGDHATKVERIATRYGIKTLIVERRLALGDLAPEIRAAWRAGKVEAMAARAFTLEPDHKAQAELFKKLAKRGQLSDWVVRRAIVGEDHNMGRDLALVGIEAYKARGGHVIVDLFSESGEGNGVSDPKLLKEMFGEALKAKCAEFVADGWQWAEWAHDLYNQNTYSWPKLKIGGKKSATADDRAKAGAILTLQRDGHFDVEYAIKPKGAKAETGGGSAGAKAGKADKKKAAGGDEAEPKLSQAIEQSLKRQATKGLAAALELYPDVGFAALVAGFAANGSGPVRVSDAGLDHGDREMSDHYDEGAGDFASALKGLLKSGSNGLRKAATEIAARALDLRQSGADMPLQEPDSAALVAALNAKAVNKAMREAFDATEYFGNVSKAFCRAAIVDAMGLDGFANVSTSPKAKIAEFAIANVPKTGWLPPELRTFAYDGPGDKPKVMRADSKAKATKKRKGR